MTLPNFLVLGAAKCGTTSLYFYMQEHPEIYLAPKEVHFFSRDDFSSTEISEAELDSYQSHFNGVLNETAIGEVAIHYLTTEWALGPIKKFLPNAKLITALRNPVDRSFSQFLMHCRLGNLRTNNGEVVGGNPSPHQIEELFSDPSAFYIDRSLYFKYLKRYYDSFPKQNMHVCLLEDLEADGNRVMQEIFQFLEVDDTFLPDTSSRYNVAKDKSHSKILMILRTSKILKQTIRAVIPRSIIEKIYRKRKKDDAAKSSRADIKMPPAVRKQLMHYFQDDISQLEDLIDRDLSLWRQS